MSERNDAEIARKAAIEQAASTVTYIMVMLTVSWLVLQRDLVKGLWGRLRHPPLSPERAREARLVAELRRDIALFEHPRGHSDPPAGGLYERP